MSPLSMDLRSRIIQAWKAEKLRVPELAARFEANPDWSIEELTAAYNKQERAEVSRSTMSRREATRAP